MTTRDLIDGFRCPVTGADDWTLFAHFTARPEGETDFGLSPYYREIWQSQSTGHAVNLHEMDLGNLYAGDYWDRTYGDGRITRIFDKIMALPPGQSDNRARVELVDGYYRARRAKAQPSVLDVGSGLAVFPAAMREAGWQATALDPDPRAAEHARVKAGVLGLAADFMTDIVAGQYDLVSFNKVLEHVPDPVSMLARAKPLIAPDGFCYVELPDAEGALADSALREELFIEHYCAFSAISYAMLATKAGFSLSFMERVIEPSGKYTLRGFLSPDVETA